MSKPIYAHRPTQWHVVPDRDRAIFGERAFSVSLDDEGAGEYVRIKDMATGGGEIAFDAAQWEVLERAIQQALTEIRLNEGRADD